MEYSIYTLLDRMGNNFTLAQTDNRYEITALGNFTKDDIYDLISTVRYRDELELIEFSYKPDNIKIVVVESEPVPTPSTEEVEDECSDVTPAQDAD